MSFFGLQNVTDCGATYGYIMELQLKFFWIILLETVYKHVCELFILFVWLVLMQCSRILLYFPWNYFDYIHQFGWRSSPFRK
jgi:hypothetical protein